MKLQLFTIEKWNDDDTWIPTTCWSIAIGNIEIFDWCGSLLAIGKFNDTYYFDLLWLRSLIFKYFNWYNG